MSNRPDGGLIALSTVSSRIYDLSVFSQSYGDILYQCLWNQIGATERVRRAGKALECFNGNAFVGASEKNIVGRDRHLFPVLKVDL